MPSWWMILDEIAGSFTELVEPDSTTVWAAELATIDRRDGSTVWLTYEDVVASRLQEWSRDGELRADDPLDPPRDLATGLPFDRRAGVLALGDEAPRLVPTFLVASDGDEGPAHVYVCSRVRESGMLFSRIWTGEAAGLGVVPLMARAREEQPQLVRRMTDDATQCMRFDEEHEIEVKFTILDETQPWEIADGLARAVQDRRLPAFIPDLGNEMQRWQYDQYTFEVLSPVERRGYIAFMTMGNATSYAVKFKFFDGDRLRRYERVIEDVPLERSDFLSYISSEVGETELRELPFLTRTRFDVNVESGVAGHFYGLEMDEVHSNGHVMRQLEIEYHRSRACFGLDAGLIEPELFRLADQVGDLFTAWGVEAERGYLSKLSFLKRVAAASPVRSPT